MSKYLPIALLVVLALAGCGEQAPDNPDRIPPPSEATIQANIDKINNDPNMTPEAKRAAIAGMEMARQRAQQGGQGSGKPQTP